MGRKCNPFCRHHLLGDTEVSPIDCHEIVIEDIPSFFTVEGDLRWGVSGGGGGGGQHETTMADNDGGLQQRPVDGDNVSWRQWPLDAVAVGNKINKQMQKNKADSPPRQPARQWP